MIGAGRAAPARHRFRRLAVSLLCSAVASVILLGASLSRRVHRMLLTTADGYCARDSVDTSRHAKWGWHRSAVRSGLVSGTCFDDPVARASLAVVISHYDEPVAWLTQLREHGLLHAHLVHHSNLDARTSGHWADLAGGGAAAASGVEPDWVRAGIVHGVPVSVVRNRGEEALAFAHWVHAHYDELPPFVAFVHAPSSDDGAGTPHFPMAVAARLRATCISDNRSYLDLNGWPDCQDHTLDLGGEGRLRCLTEKPRWHFNRERRRLLYLRLRQAWRHTLGGALGPLPERVIADCCAQFVARREALQRLSRETWALLVRALQAEPTETEEEEEQQQQQQQQEQQQTGSSRYDAEVTLALNDAAFQNPAMLNTPFLKHGMLEGHALELLWRYLLGAPNSDYIAESC